MEKASEQDREELYEYMTLYDMTDCRISGGEPYVVPERLMESFVSSRGLKYHQIANFSFPSFPGSRDEPPVFEVIQYMDYIADRRYNKGLAHIIGKMSSNMKLYLYYPTRRQYSNNSSKDTSQTPSPRNSSPQINAPLENLSIQDTKDDPSAIDEAIAAKPELIKYPRSTIDDKVDILRRIFLMHFPDYYMKFTAFGSSVCGIAFPNSKLNINIEMDLPDMKSLLIGSLYRGSVEPHDFEFMSGVLKSVGATKVTYDSITTSTSFYLDGFGYEYVFNHEIATKSTNLIEQYLELDDRVLSFIKTLKFFGRGRNIFSPQLRSNSIRSYAYIIMGLSFLVSLYPPVIPNLQNLNPKDIQDLCMSDDCTSKKVFWGTAIHHGTVVGAAARFHNCIEQDANASPCSHRVKRNGSKLYWNSSNKATVGELFIDFLYYYGYNFDFKNFAVSLKMGGIAHRKDEFKNDLVVIEDPILSGVNLGVGIIDETGFRKFRNTLRGAFTLLYSNTPFDILITRTPDLHQYDNVQGKSGTKEKYRPFMRTVWTPSTKTIALVGLPKIPDQDRDNTCYCDRIINLFASYGVVDRLVDLDYTVKQITFTDIKRNVNDILIPTSFMFDDKKVYLVELYDTIVAEA